jgi:uncharacterized C2H2 Zn-finger protein
MQSRKKVTRLFHGVAGSPLSQSNDVATAAPLSGAERARLYRERHGAAGRKKAAEQKARKRDEQKNDVPTQLKQWNEVLVEQGLSVNRGAFLTAAPSGKGQLISGGWDSTKASLVEGIQESDTGRVTGQGASSQHMEDGGKIVGGAKGAHYVPTSTPRFQVKLDAHEFDGFVEDVIAQHFETVKANDIADGKGNPILEYFRCTLCGAQMPWHKDRNRHVENMHMDLVQRMAKDWQKEDRRLRKLGKQALNLLEEKKAFEDRQQARREGWTQRADGTWVQSPVTDKA